jgi:cytosine/adenosine deaminase-related metal-dependent hydrolase
LRALGFNICLGTDSLASNADLSLFAEMRALQRSEPALSPKEVLEMVTRNAALALGKPQALGRIRTNYFADLIAIPCNGKADVFEEILAFDRPVDWMMVAGKT